MEWQDRRGPRSYNDIKMDTASTYKYISDVEREDIRMNPAFPYSMCRERAIGGGCRRDTNLE